VAAVGTSKTAVYSHVATASDPASFVFDFSDYGWHLGGMKAFRGTDPAHPPTAAAAAGSQIPSVTPTAPNSWTSTFAVADFEGSEWPDYLWFSSPSSPDWSEIAYTDVGGRSITSASNGPLGDAGTPTDFYDIWAGWQAPAVAGGVTTLLTAQPIPPAPTTKYGYLGAKARSTELPSGTVEMGVRTYVPQLGRFLQVDPVSGGSANAYDYVNQDPLNAFDLDGTKPYPKDAGKPCQYNSNGTYWGCANGSPPPRDPCVKGVRVVGCLAGMGAYMVKISCMFVSTYGVVTKWITRLTPPGRIVSTACGSLNGYRLVKWVSG
jgi:RHS repeat-associated protein